MIKYENKSDRWQFENEFCTENCEVWIHEAINLMYSAKVINDYIWNLSDELLNKKNFNQKYPTFWSPRVERMLWGYAFENLFKAKIISDFKKSEIIKEVPLSEIKSHDLLLLANKAKIELSDDEKFYLRVLEKCAVWAGRYPIPIKESQLPQTRKPIKNREELFERNNELCDLLLKGKIKRTVVENDVLHSGVGTLELKLYDNLFLRIKNQINNQPQHRTKLKTKSY